MKNLAIYLLLIVCLGGLNTQVYGQFKKGSSKSTSKKASSYKNTTKLPGYYANSYAAGDREIGVVILTNDIHYVFGADFNYFVRRDISLGAQATFGKTNYSTVDISTIDLKIYGRIDLLNFKNKIFLSPIAGVNINRPSFKGVTVSNPPPKILTGVFVGSELKLTLGKGLSVAGILHQSLILNYKTEIENADGSISDKRTTALTYGITLRKKLL